MSQKVIDRIDEAGICWDFNSDWGCHRLGCRLRHELVESSYPAIGEQPQESSEEKSKRDSEMLQYFQKIDQVTQNQKKAQAPPAPPPAPPEINPQHSTILDEPMDVINNEPVNNEPLVPESAPPPKSYAQPPIPPKYRTGKETTVRVAPVNPTKAPRIIRAPANVVTIAAPTPKPKPPPENPPEEEPPKPPLRPPGLGITRPDKKKRLSPKNGNNSKPITKGKCCLLCRRRFKSVEMLNKHIKESALHRQNLKKRAEEQGLSVPEEKAPQDDNGVEGSIFRAYA